MNKKSLENDIKTFINKLGYAKKDVVSIMQNKDFKSRQKKLDKLLSTIYSEAEKHKREYEYINCIRGRINQLEEYKNTEECAHGSLCCEHCHPNAYWAFSQ